MLPDEDIVLELGPIAEPSFTPELFAPPWNGQPEDVLDVELSFPYNRLEWEYILSTFIELIGHQSHDTRDSAIRRSLRVLEILPTQKALDSTYQAPDAHDFLQELLAAIAHHLLKYPDLFESSCKALRWSNDELKPEVIFAWFDQLEKDEEQEYPTTEQLLAARLLLGVYEKPWAEVGQPLLAWLDHEDLTVRACAANQIAKLYRQAILGVNLLQQRYREQGELAPLDPTQTDSDLPPFAEILDLITTKEIERPGIAGAFLWKAPQCAFDVDEWVLKVLERSPEPEPAVTYFPCNLAFDAHERFCRNADAIRRLLKMDRLGIAILALLDAHERVDELEPILIELGHSAEHVSTVRVMAWHLAYYYQYLHPRGVELGYVEHINHLPEVELYVLFNAEEPDENPYGVVIYAKERRQKLSRTIAQKWVDRIFPDSVRGEPHKDEMRSHWYQRGYVDYHYAPKSYRTPPPDFIDNVIIGYRSKQPWHPRQFLGDLIEN